MDYLEIKCTMKELIYHEQEEIICNVWKSKMKNYLGKTNLVFNYYFDI